MKKLIYLLLLIASPVFAKTLTSITVLPAADGYHISSSTGTTQLTAQCNYSDAVSDNCSGETLTWGSSNPGFFSVNSTGLVTGAGSPGTPVLSLSATGSFTNQGTLFVKTAYVFTGGLATTVASSESSLAIPDNNELVVASPSAATNAIGYNVYIRTFSGGELQQNNSPIPIGTNFTYGQNNQCCSGTPSGAQDIYVFSGTILGHHPVNSDTYIRTGLLGRPETSDPNVVVGSTVLVSAADITDPSQIPIGNQPVGDICAWTSSVPSVATVNNIGEVTGIAVGSTVVTCTLGTLTVDRTVNVIAPTETDNTYFVRPDGGTRWSTNVTTGQCNGTANVAYSGTGVNQNCSWNNPMYAFTDESSASVYTGALQGTDTLIIAPSTVPYPVGTKSDGVTGWITNDAGAMAMQSGSVLHPTRILGSNFGSCQADMHDAGNRSSLIGHATGNIIDVRGAQNFQISCLDIGTAQDCNSKLGSIQSFPCPNGVSPYIILGNNFTSGYTITNDRLHGGSTAWTGTAGPVGDFSGTTSEMNFSTGFNFDDPFGYTGNRTDNFFGVATAANYSGCTEEVAKNVTSVNRDGAGNLTVNFSAGQIVNYEPKTNITLVGMTPSDLNGTYPVNSISFNQQAVSITGGSCVQSDVTPVVCTVTTSTAPSFTIGSFVNITGASPSFLNGGYEVSSTSSTGFVILASPLTRLGWVAGATISAAGTASTASQLTATSAGTSEAASTVGTASHVHPAHRCADQNDGGFSNGDGVGTGGNTIGHFFCDRCQFHLNFQDGWDMLHSWMSTSTFTNAISEGNEGAPAKFGNADVGIFQNNLMIASGGQSMSFNPDLPPDYNQYIGLPYRAGDGFPLASRAWSRMNITNNTFDVGFSTIIDDDCYDVIGCIVMTQSGIASFVMQNNIFAGYLDATNPSSSGSVPGMYFQGSAIPAPWVWTNNIGWNVRNTPSTGTGNNWSLNPKLLFLIPDITNLTQQANTQLWNANLQQTSPAIAFGITNSLTPLLDNAGLTRPNPASAGALEFTAGTLITIAVAPSSKTIIIGDTVSYVATCTYSTGIVTTPCTTTWSGTNAHSSVGSTTGVVTGVSVGTDTITSTVSTVFGTATVTVNPIPPFIGIQGVVIQGPIH